MPFQNLYLSNHSKHTLTLGVENIVGTKRKIKESESETGQVTIDRVIENNNAPTKKTCSLKLSLNEEYHINSKNMLSGETKDLVPQL